jgi:hypothetical protein
MKSALEQARLLRVMADDIVRSFLAPEIIIPTEVFPYIPDVAETPGVRACDCCGDKYLEQDLYPDKLNGLICETCRDDFADIDVPEREPFDPLDQD